MTTDVINGVPRELRSVLSMILSALDRDAAEGKTVRGEMAEELRTLLATAQPAADGERGADKWAEYKKKFCGCKDASRLNSCRGLANCELPANHPERKKPASQPQQAVAVTDAMVLAACGVCVSFRGHYGEHNDYLDDCTARQIIKAALSAHKTGEEE